MLMSSGSEKAGQVTVSHSSQVFSHKFLMHLDGTSYTRRPLHTGKALGAASDVLRGLSAGGWGSPL